MTRPTVLIAALALAACNNSPGGASQCEPTGAIHDAGERVLTVNGTPVGEKELELVFKRMNVPEEKRGDYAWTRSGKHVAEEYALATVLYQRALDEHILDDPDLQLELAFVERQYLSSVMRNKLAHAAVTDEAIQRFYDENKDVFLKPEAKVRQILVPNKPLADSMVERLNKGEDFAALAKAHSIDQESAARGGELGWIKQGENPNIGEQVLAGQKGEILGPIESRLGYHVVEIEDKRDLTPLEDVKPLAAMSLANEEAARVLEEIRGQMEIKWDKEPEAGGGEMPPADGAPHGPGGPADGAGMPPGGMPPGGMPPGGGSPHGPPPEGGAPSDGGSPHGDLKPGAGG
ncbi:MAG: peptidylprolyl isomerase [Myxococcota bacterium]